jgi:DNA-binding LacI/PurR family transcriptional regulator/DNA-binding transcriptional regulator YhcF (GntR family)
MPEPRAASQPPASIIHFPRGTPRGICAVSLNGEGKTVTGCVFFGRNESSLKPPTTVIPDYQGILKVLAKQTFEPGVAVERQVARHVRRLIEKEKLAPNTRLPPIRTLADFWGTNYFTVQAALRRLVGEGLLVQSPKKGTFVAPALRRLRRVCLYHDHNLAFSPQEEFTSRLNVWIYRVLSERGLQTVPVFDKRPGEKLHTMPTEVRNLIKDREIDALIASAIQLTNRDWLSQIEVPVAAFLLDESQGGVEINFEQMARLAVREAARLKSRHFGVVYRSPVQKLSSLQGRSFLDLLKRLAAEKGIAVSVPEFPIKEADRFRDWQELSHLLTEMLLKKTPRPDALFIFPDSYLQGVTNALLRHDISVPGDIQLIAHRNFESRLYVPFPVTWITVKIEDFARGLLAQIEQKFAGEKPARVIVSCSVERHG